MPYWDPIDLSGSHPGPRNSVPLWILAADCARGGHPVVGELERDLGLPGREDCTVGRETRRTVATARRAGTTRWRVASVLVDAHVAH